ncbi:hypothetical protein NST02_23585 [Robertmurraya sp. FSL W8-0741]|uniref:hypothetical protein n=1 Tax=Robertmurraya sp. FSL W8-0741 TaxID=2954629 RepID=UPI0030F65573
MVKKNVNLKVEMKDIFKLVHHEISDTIYSQASALIDSKKDNYTTDEAIQLFAKNAAKAYEIELTHKMKQKYDETINRVSF